MYEYPNNNLNSYKNLKIDGTNETLGLQWAKKYLQNLDVDFQNNEPIKTQNLNEIVSQAGRQQTAQKPRLSIRNVSLQAWKKTEKLLFKEVKKHSINSELIDPWEIAGNSFKIYEKALDVYIQQAAPRQLFMVMKLVGKEKLLSSKAFLIYTQQLAPNQFAKTIAASLEALRQKYTHQDLRVIDFVNMQFHYTSQMLLLLLSPLEQSLLNSYFKMIDNYLYMPLQRAYTVADKIDCDSVALIAGHLLPSNTHITKGITQRIIKLYPIYGSYFGCLNNKKGIISNIRNMEVFQVYLWVYADKENIAATQQKLFLLRVMLYQTLKVSWEIIRQMLHLLGLEISERLNTERANILMPYFQVMKASVFS